VSEAANEKTQQQVAQAISRTTRQVHNLTKDGVFVRVPSATDPAVLVYPWPETLEKWTKHQAEHQTGAARRAKKSDREKAARADAASIDAEMKRFRLEQLKGEWVRKEDYRAELRRVLTAINGVLDLVPGRHGPKLPGDATVAEKVLALRGIVAEVRAAMRNAGAPDEATTDARANP
jgi:hypothetical protein